MKKHIGISLVVCVVFAFQFSSCNSGEAEIDLADSTGMPGDNFSLAGALNLLKESNNLEEFEKGLNTKKGEVNNLDLNGDGKIDYIRVIDNLKENSHAIVLQIPVNKDEAQDVAIISIKKTGDKKAFIQIKGNEMLYGDSAVLAPESGDGKIANASMTPEIFKFTAVDLYVNVWGWPVVPVLYSPAYVVYESPVVLWNVYPTWYEPWPPYPYGWYRREVAHRHKKYYTPVYFLAPTPALVMYGPTMRNSVFVVNRYQSIYVKNGWPKARGRAYYGPSGPVYMHGPAHMDHGNGAPMKMKGGGPGKGAHGMKGSPSGSGGMKVGAPNSGGNKGGGHKMNAPGPKGGGGAPKSSGGGGKGGGGNSKGGSGGGHGGGGKK
ncbi:MAG: hypothetical protein KG003_11035 [Bacteroidetes bacterium]|nr:hypothetical protein [Bacteroidota bacterium]